MQPHELKQQMLQKRADGYWSFVLQAMDICRVPIPEEEQQMLQLLNSASRHGFDTPSAFNEFHNLADTPLSAEELMQHFECSWEQLLEISTIWYLSKILAEKAQENKQQQLLSQLPQSPLISLSSLVVDKLPSHKSQISRG